MSYMIESILTDKNDIDCPFFHHFYALVILKSKISFLKPLQIPCLGLTRLHGLSLSW